MTADIQAIIDALPQPIIVLDARLFVVRFNAAARALFPALRPQEPLALGLRAPEVLEAARRAAVTGQSQSIEYSERVPVDRWYEAQVTPASAQLTLPLHGGILLLSLHDLTPLRRADLFCI